MIRILAFHAHPDDIETLAAGTLALLAAAGHDITLVTMTAGDLGSVEHDAVETARIRKAEAAAAAAVIGAQYRCADVGDLCVFGDDATRRRTTEIIRAVRPDLVLTASPQDYHPDHEATSALVRDACFAAPVPNYKTGSAPPLAAIPHLYFCDPIDGRDRAGRRVAPDFAVDVTPFFAAKHEMLAAHASQRNWVLTQHGIDDYAGSMERWTAKRGREFGVAYAEGFRQYTGTPYPRSPLLQDLVGAALRTV
jgi:N-acetylglucosamine malate deacetylase 1